MHRWLSLLSICISVSAIKAPTVHDASCAVTYNGFEESGVENFFSIPYGQDTGGSNRFKPPKPYTPPPGSSIDATSRGPECPQPRKAPAIPFYWSNYSHVSEDCLHLNVYRPKNTAPNAKLPVLIYIHGGSFFEGSKDELVSQPPGLILQSVNNGDPIIAVTINYRLGAFGFAQSDALLDEGSTNAGLRDQRLGIEWVRDHIGAFGGDGSRITISGQSSGGLYQFFPLQPVMTLNFPHQVLPLASRSWPMEAASLYPSTRPSAKAKLSNQVSLATSPCTPCRSSLVLQVVTRRIFNQPKR